MTIAEEDARALYLRLAKNADELNNGAHTKVRTGVNYKCMMDKQGRSRHDYQCDFDLTAIDGLVLQQYPVSGAGVADQAGPYTGKNLEVAGPGLNPNEAYVSFSGGSASYIYKHMNVNESRGTIDLLQRVSARIKTGRQIQCYLPDGSNKARCRMKVNTITGEAIRLN
jgi:hypothetical protein